MKHHNAVAGISDHGGWAILVTATRQGVLLDRRRVELVDADLPKIPHHSEAQQLPIDQAVELIERVRISAEKHAAIALEGVAQAVPGLLGVALRVCPPLPPTIAGRIQDYRSQNNADWVMYRNALALAAEARGWQVYWYESKKVLAMAAEALGAGDIQGYFAQLRKTIGPPWDQDHKLAFSAAVAAAHVIPVETRP